jgi:hypothetical protein
MVFYKKWNRFVSAVAIISVLPAISALIMIIDNNNQGEIYLDDSNKIDVVYLAEFFITIFTASFVLITVFFALLLVSAKLVGKLLRAK